MELAEPPPQDVAIHDIAIAVRQTLNGVLIYMNIGRRGTLVWFNDSISPHPHRETP